MRAVLAVKDDFYHRHIVKLDLLKPVFAVLSEIGIKDNMVVSAILDLVEFIRIENIRVLVEYIVEKYSAVLQQLEHVDIYDKLLIRYEQTKDSSIQGMGTTEGPSSSLSTLSGNDPRVSKINSALGQLRNKHLAERDNEDNYFEDDDTDNDKGFVDRHRPFMTTPVQDSLSVLSTMYATDDEISVEASNENSKRANDVYENKSSSSVIEIVESSISFDHGSLKKHKVDFDDEVGFYPSTLPPLSSKDNEDLVFFTGVVQKPMQKKNAFGFGEIKGISFMNDAEADIKPTKE